MSEICETVKIKVDDERGHVIINKEDFDPKKHDLFVENVTPDLKSMSKAELVKLADARKVDHDGLTKAELIEALSKE